MTIETRKLRLIEDFIKVRDHALLGKIEALLKQKPLIKNTASIDKFAGTWSTEEANEMKAIIAAGCEKW
jgi:hypothetical protein